MSSSSFPPGRLAFLGGVAVGLALTYHGITVLIPQLGAFGVVFTLIGVAVTLSQGLYFVRHGRSQRANDAAGSDGQGPGSRRNREAEGPTGQNPE